jgi:hypothetical protein
MSNTTVDEINGDWFVIEIIAGPFPTNASAWTWIDRNSRAERGSRRDRPASQSHSKKGDSNYVC